MIKKILKKNIPEPLWDYIKHILTTKFKSNIFNTSHDKNVLISYIISPFLTKENNVSHPIWTESREIAKLFNKLKYNVDVINLDSIKILDYSKYDLIFGFGKPFNMSFNYKFNGKRIFHGTGANPIFWDKAESLRIKSNYLRNKKRLIPRRVSMGGLNSFINADGMTLIGNKWTKFTYEGFNDNIFCLPAIILSSVINENIKRDTSKTKFCFTWFGSLGAVHKGLDLLLEAMLLLDERFCLNICGLHELETDFIEHYKDLIYNHPRIINHGFVDISSEKMSHILSSSSFVIHPSCAEGSATSVLSCMAGGLVPIITEQTGISIDNLGLLIETTTPEGIANIMKKASELPDDTILKLSSMSISYVRKIHTVENYKSNLTSAIIDITK